MNPRRLYRCRHDRQLAGVAAGMAEYLDVDPTLIRVLWIVSALFGGVTILLYVILAFVIPLEPVPFGSGAAPTGADAGAGEAGERGEAAPSAPVGDTYADWHRAYVGQPHDRGRGGRAGVALGVLLVIFGGIALVDAIIPGLAAAPLLGPAFVVALGAALLVGSVRRAPDGGAAAER